MNDRLIKEIEALKVAPDEVLILRVPQSWMPDDPGAYDPVPDLLAHLRRLGLGERSLVIMGETEFAIVKAEES